MSITVLAKWPKNHHLGQVTQKLAAGPFRSINYELGTTAPTIVSAIIESTS